MGLVLTQPICPTPWTRHQNPLGLVPPYHLITKKGLQEDTYFVVKEIQGEEPWLFILINSQIFA